jgi:hypothetical protein
MFSGGRLGSREIAEFMRRSRLENTERASPGESKKRYVSALRTLVAATPPSTDYAIVYRGVPASALNKLDRSMMSATTDFDVAVNYTTNQRPGRAYGETYVTAAILIPPGTRFVTVGGVHDQEVLLPPGTLRTYGNAVHRTREWSGITNSKLRWHSEPESIKNLRRRPAGATWWRPQTSNQGLEVVPVLYDPDPRWQVPLNTLPNIVRQNALSFEQNLKPIHGATKLRNNYGVKPPWPKY